MTTTGTGRAQSPPLSRPPRLLRLPGALLRTARPHQWPKNLLVLAAPLAAATLGRHGHRTSDLALAVGAFICASAAVYAVNDVMDADRDREHPRKRTRPVASGQLGPAQAMTMAAVCGLCTALGATEIDSLWFTLLISAYLATSLLYSLGLKHLPVLELAVVASGFVLRILGGAAAGRIAPSAWFVLVCSLGALLVATAKRATELAALGTTAARQHRPSLRHYTPAGLRLGKRLTALAMLAAYYAWCLTEPDLQARAWHLATLLPLTGALLRFDRLTAGSGLVRVEDLLTRDRGMLCWELLWLALFLPGVLT
ncbi:decaprenyl-phosphate phosphoribosyltransferase [Streptacidiphilus carbonis]|uniref:decaprenyl-phosphate phosphoribosyltransferase n=1 Tax=Streptacidiphilus carbonis TaxID=105422 RepID=UPI0006944386|nr:decaprenyl-phosphate phosphoribosyltransferase [Streptacidiphilus carbonis]